MLSETNKFQINQGSFQTPFSCTFYGIELFVQGIFSLCEHMLEKDSEPNETSAYLVCHSTNIFLFFLAFCKMIRDLTALICHPSSLDPLISAKASLFDPYKHSHLLTIFLKEHAFV
jgi:hypothetical protein